MVWRIEKSEKIEWNGMGRMIGANMGYKNKNMITTSLQSN